MRQCEYDVGNSQVLNGYSVHFYDVDNNIDGKHQRKTSLSQSFAVNGALANGGTEKQLIK